MLGSGVNAMHEYTFRTLSEWLLESNETVHWLKKQVVYE